MEVQATAEVGLLPGLDWEVGQGKWHLGQDYGCGEEVLKQEDHFSCERLWEVVFK